jgi:hypothetical protein
MGMERMQMSLNQLSSNLEQLLTQRRAMTCKALQFFLAHLKENRWQTVTAKEDELDSCLASIADKGREIKQIIPFRRRSEEDQAFKIVTTGPVRSTLRFGHEPMGDHARQTIHQEVSKSLEETVKALFDKVIMCNPSKLAKVNLSAVEWLEFVCTEDRHIGLASVYQFDPAERRMITSLAVGIE